MGSSVLSVEICSNAESSPVQGQEEKTFLLNKCFRRFFQLLFCEPVSQLGVSPSSGAEMPLED